MRKWKYVYYNNIDSTSNEAERFYNNQKDKSDAIVIFADVQNSGRGRSKNLWSSPKGNVYMTAIICPRSDEVYRNVSEVGKISFAIGLAVVKTIEEYISKQNVQIKWPNDILINKKKCAGILIELKTENDLVKAILVGIGINIVSSPVDVNYDTAHLNKYNEDVNRSDVLYSLCSNLNLELENLNRDFDSVRTQWLNSHLARGEELLLRVNGETKEIVKFIDITEDGAFIYSYKGKQFKIFSGEIILPV